MESPGLRVRRSRTLRAWQIASVLALFVLAENAIHEFIIAPTALSIAADIFDVESAIAEAETQSSFDAVYFPRALIGSTGCENCFEFRPTALLRAKHVYTSALTDGREDFYEVIENCSTNDCVSIPELPNLSLRPVRSETVRTETKEIVDHSCKQRRIFLYESRYCTDVSKIHGIVSGISYYVQLEHSYSDIYARLWGEGPVDLHLAGISVSLVTGEIINNGIPAAGSLEGEIEDVRN